MYEASLCRRCGISLPENATYCPSCGASRNKYPSPDLKQGSFFPVCTAIVIIDILVQLLLAALWMSNSHTGAGSETQAYQSMGVGYAFLIESFVIIPCSLVALACIPIGMTNGKEFGYVIFNLCALVAPVLFLLDHFV